ncbi:hypothetical protein Sango_2833600 [Sesamum angolense]|uniref:DUF7906 domain-containing protein n=1 Tax=Sesamum angolense TaxID=2727404 RepID=A0AAE1T7B1_9LAMI|nr:hypothetical protein Sango_2833600 [Sesamum angolense]
MWRSASMFGPHISRFLSLVLLSLLLFGDRSNGAPFQNRRSGKSSVFSLFNLKEKSRFWSESVIRSDFDDLESSSPGKFEAINYTKAGELTAQQLPENNSKYMVHIDTIVVTGTLCPLCLSVNGSRRVNGYLTMFHKGSFSRVLDFCFSVHAIQMGEKVTSIFERAIDVLGRTDDISGTRDDGVGLWQVDVDMMDVVFTSLVEYLQLEDAYNIFILNPKRDAKRVKYGYRRGLSESEINYLKENKALQARILQPASIPESVLALDKIKRPLYEKHPMAKFSWTVTEETDTIEWYNKCLDALNNVERLYQGKDTADIIQSKVLQLLNGKYNDLKLISEKDLKSGDFSGFHAECLTDTWIGNQRWAFIDLTAGPFSWGPSVGGEGVRTEQSLPNVEKTIGAVADPTFDSLVDPVRGDHHGSSLLENPYIPYQRRMKEHQAIDILLAEIDIYELFSFKHCKGRKVKLALCEELDERMQDLKNELQAFEGEEYDESHKRKAMEALKRMENWNLFSDTHEKVRHIKQLPIDLKSLMDGLSSLVLPSQKVQFSPHMLPLSEDPALAMAFSAARRAAAVPLLLVNGTYRKTVRSYLDSSILQHQLQRLNDHASLKGSHAHSRSTLEVPIFWFIHGDALLVDKHYQAKALSDMVIVVQSEPSSWESHLQCNGQSLLWDLRRPTKAALAAVSEHLAGLLPLHLVYSLAHETAIEDWIWSVGCNPLSVTSQGWHISQFQYDTIARSYILTTVEESIQVVNSAFIFLSWNVPVSFLVVLVEASRTDFQALPFPGASAALLITRQMLVISNFLWVFFQISTVTGELRYTDALRLLHTLEDASKGFADYVNATIVSLHPVHCTRQRKVEVEFDATTFPAFLVVILILWFVLKPRRPKPKIN